MKAIQLLVNSQLPPDLRDYSRSMDAKSISNLMAEVARKYPEQYERISKSVSDIGRNAAYIQGETLTLNDNKPVIDLHTILKEMDDEVDAARKSTPDKDEFEAKRNSIWEKFNERIDKDTSSAALAKGNNLAYSVVSGARGKSQQLKMMISTPGLYTDAQDDLVPIFVRNSFGEGLRPAEYLASTYGARKSVLCLHEDTLVRKPDGSSVAIKDIQVDDVVMGADIQSNKIPVSVVAVYKQGRQPVNKYIFRKAGSNAVRSVTCTENHKFLATTVNGVEVLPIKDIIYSNVLLLDGAVWRLTDVEQVGLKQCYDIEVDNEDHLFVLESGIIVSNSTKRATAKGGDLCLVKGTSVRMADGTEKNIEDIVVGDKVLGCSTAGVATPVDVVNTFYQGYKQTYDVGFPICKGSRKYGVIGCTLNHKFLCSYSGNKSGAFIRSLNDRSRRDMLVRSDTSLARIASIVDTGYRECYDIEVDHPDHLFVLANNIITSNSKQMTQSAAHIVVSENDCGVGNGIALDMDDRSVRGRVLAREVGGLPAGTALDRDAMAALRRKGVSKVIARSAMTCQSKEGVCSKCLGLNALGKFPMRGESVGITAANSIGEPITQGALNCLVENTKVLMSDSTEKNIQDIVPGDMVMGSDMLGNISPTKVTHIWDQGMQPAQRRTYKTTDGYVYVESTEIHKILSVTGNDDVPELLTAGYTHDKVSIILSNGTKAVRDNTSEVNLGMQHCYDITVDNDDSLFVLASNIICSNTKHTGGAAGANRRFAGFPVINQFVQSPEVFPDKAVVSTIDGTVSSIMDAPQGGFYVTVNNEPHYVPPGYPAIVKVGDKVEAGDILTQGLPDPGDVVDYKGLGAGRKYYADKLKELLDDSGMEADRRNTELMARAALDHVQITGVPDDESGYIPDDVISYSSLANTYVPPVDTTKGPSKKFIGSYLQAPALHYTIGTKITPKLSKELDELGYGDVYASPAEPIFKPIMPRLRSAAHNNPDWLASMHTSYLKKQLSESAIRGEDTNVESNTHFAPRLAIGTNFGDNITQTGKF